MIIRKGEILIFKASPEGSRNDDSYKKKLIEAGYLVQNIPVLEFEYCQGAKALTLIQDVNRLLKKWKNLPVFVVGEETGRIVKTELDLDGRGSSSGNAAALADVILQDTYTKPFLFPCGNLSRDVLPTKLSEGGINLMPITVYQTQMHQHLEQLIRDVLQDSQFPEVLVYFSPSGVKFTLPILKRLDVPIHQLKFVAIGQTTEGALAEHNLKVSAVASKPTPEHLLEALRMI
ncbi:Uroporphyrinogen-III synthase [Blattella germanica]|nr:Uroporphyrinogen-III synthase [Blattella germanica]